MSNVAGIVRRTQRTIARAWPSGSDGHGSSRCYGAAMAAAAGARSRAIVSTQLGEVPTTGALRPGPIGLLPPQPAQLRGPRPVSITIQKIGVDATIETIEIVDGVMQDPTGPWVVSWYKETARLGEVGNVVMAGHLDYWDVGPAVFYNIAQLHQG
ncbi:MAG: hypothetical protein KatS3mg059_0503 [Thermomicrobiales bacterium]|nr:MAG: hypothetical protein KatS3mg059_0503 [Thermomicrobiales bacterium]